MIDITEYDKKRLKQLAFLCIDKNITTQYMIYFKVNTLGKNKTDGYYRPFLSWEIDIRKGEKRIKFDSFDTPYPLDRIINFIGGLK